MFEEQVNMRLLKASRKEEEDLKDRRLPELQDIKFLQISNCQELGSLESSSEGGRGSVSAVALIMTLFRVNVHSKQEIYVIIQYKHFLSSRMLSNNSKINNYIASCAILL